MATEAKLPGLAELEKQRLELIAERDLAMSMIAIEAENKNVLTPINHKLAAIERAIAEQKERDRLDNEARTKREAEAKAAPLAEIAKADAEQEAIIAALMKCGADALVVRYLTLDRIYDRHLRNSVGVFPIPPASQAAQKARLKNLRAIREVLVHITGGLLHVR